jgi:NAD(P)-dependent dehydrogenase (short-subunit alcohol dehydrogenase family)
MKLANHVAIVTGSGTGTGASIARLFAKEGAAVTITGRRQEVLARMVDAIAQSGGHSLAVPGSVTEEADVQRAVHTTLERFGRVDILVNNAGSTSNAGPLHEMTDKTWDQTMDVFLRGVFRFSRAVIPGMIQQGGGAIVNIASVFGLKAVPRFPVHAYAVAKAGVVMLTKTIAIHYAQDKIRCNCIAPAIVETPFTASRTRDATVRAALEARHPLGRLGTPEDIARAAVYFASDESLWTTGRVLTVDGGVMAQ